MKAKKNILNSQHNDINFMMKKSNHNFSFLDVEIELSDVSLNTCIKQKPTNIGLLLIFCTPVTRKSNLII